MYARRQTSGPFARWGSTALLAACSRHLASQVSIALRDLPRRSCARKVLFALTCIQNSHARLETHARLEALLLSHARQGSCACWEPCQTARGGFSVRMRRVPLNAQHQATAQLEARRAFHAFQGSRVSQGPNSQETARLTSDARPWPSHPLCALGQAFARKIQQPRCHATGNAVRSTVRASRDTCPCTTWPLHCLCSRTRTTSGSTTRSR